MEPKMAVAFMSVISMVAVFFLAFADGMLLPSQMMQQGYKEGFPVVANGSIWANLLLMSAVLYLITGYRIQWGPNEIILWVIIGMFLSYGLFKFVYMTGKFPDALADGGRDMSPAGAVMWIYCSVIIAAIGLFYLRTNAIGIDVVAIWVLLAIYIPIANHAVLAMINAEMNFVWCPAVFSEESSPMKFIIYGEVGLAIASLLKLKVWQYI